jgi:lysophospholipase L1-like esterase
MRLPSLFAVTALLLAPFIQAAPLVQNGQTVAFLGDSITQGGAATSGGYVRLVASGLAANGIEIKVIPAGISGHKSDQMLSRLEGHVLSKKPDWMTLSCGVNDVWHGSRGAGVSLEDYKKNITTIVDRCQAAGVKVLILTSTQINLPVTNELNTKLADYNAFLRDLAKERGLPLADLNADMLAEQNALAAAGLKRSLTTDGVHMNIYGNLMMARGVLKAFGLDAAQLTKTEAAWSEISDAYQTTAKVALSLNELAALEKAAAAQNKSAQDLINTEATAAAKAAIKAAR